MLEGDLVRQARRPGPCDMAIPINPEAEWIETDGLGGYASGTVAGFRTRRYHGLLVTALHPPVDRVVLVNGLDAEVEDELGAHALSSQVYEPDVIHPDGAQAIQDFEPEPWPRWRYCVGEMRIAHELFVVRGAPICVLTWRLLEPRAGVVLRVRPFLSGRDFHKLHTENDVFRFGAQTRNGRIHWQPYAALPGIVAVHNGSYQHQPNWYRNFLYREERRRGLDCDEDLACPGVLRWNLSRGEAVLLLAVEGSELAHLPETVPPEELLAELRHNEQQRRRHLSRPLERAADAYLVRGAVGQTVIAGYPWFADRARDAFIAMRGLCIATGRLREASQILRAWARHAGDGTLPDVLPMSERPAEYHSIDASLWYVVAIHDYLQARLRTGHEVAQEERDLFVGAVESILAAYRRGTRLGIRADDDGLLVAEPTTRPLTWMDTVVSQRPVTPRVGKPVEVQALWVAALAAGEELGCAPAGLHDRAERSFARRFWNAEAGALFDVIDAGHEAGGVDSAIRPNQILAVGGLPFVLLDPARARSVVDVVEHRLLTPKGLRTLEADDPAFRNAYAGGVYERDAAYHQGTVWTWLIGPFAEAWVRVHGSTRDARAEARNRFLKPLLRSLDDDGLGHLSELADGQPPHRPTGCPFHAMAVGEALRLERSVLAG